MPNESVTREHLSTPTSALETTEAPQRSSASPAHPSGLAIIGSKIGPAAPARSVLARPRLVDWFGQHADARLILINAEAGYGKTTLLGEFANHTRDRVVWYRLERSDGDWITFLSYLVAGLRGVWPSFGRPTEALLRNVAAMGSTQEVVLAQFLADLGMAEAGRVALILDDYHLVGESPDVRMIVSRMLERAPEGMYFILSGRGAPNLAVGRLMGQGRVHTLDIDDLRFTLSEIEQLFATTYGRPLGDKACQIIAERTEGWAAGLQLVAASIAVSQPDEVGEFMRALSGARGPIYDFLAEEVLTRLSPETQRVLMHASLVDRVLIEYVVVALEAGGVSYGQQEVEAALSRAESLGLLSGRAEASGGRRMQALFREFLQVHLEREVPSGSILRMHLALAQACEQADWLMAARHYAMAEHPAGAMRVLGSAAGDALGTGAWGAVVEIVEMMPSTPPPTAVQVIQARALISDEHPEAAIELLQSIDRDSLNAEERGLVSLTWAAIHHMNGESGHLHDEVDAIVGDASVPSLLRDVGVSWQLMLQAASGGSIADAVSSLRLMASEQSKLDLHYFAGVTLHNASAAELARGKFREAIELGDRSLFHLARTDEHSSIGPSTRSIQAAALAEQGDLEEGLRLATAAATSPGATADAIAEAAYLHAVCGRTQRARTLLMKFDRGDARWARDPSSQALGWYARYALAMSSGSLDSARLSLEAVGNLTPYDFDSRSRQSVLAATLAVSVGSPDAAGLVDRATQTVTQQNAWRWMIRVRVLDAIVRRDGESLALWISEAESDSALTILELADAVATAVGSLAPVPQALERSILREPTRWVGALSRQVRDRPSEDAGAAAALIARYGTADDAHLLREYERGPSGRPKRRGLATQLIRRVSPTVRVHDLGLTSYDIGDRVVHLTETRRKTAALLLYLVTRADLAANREQVMEALWPDQTPKSALNSLHQTIFFLRRELEPWYEDGATADYVHMDTELVRLDRDLFQVDSVAFARQAADIATTGTAETRGPELLALYRGQFAPEFEYDEWATEWRTHLHTSYLHLAHATAASLIRDRRYGEAVEVLSPVAGLDPNAFELRGALVGCLAAAGARDASLAQYRSLAVAHERDLGLPARPYQDLVDAVSAMT